MCAIAQKMSEHQESPELLRIILLRTLVNRIGFVVREAHVLLGRSVCSLIAFNNCMALSSTHQPPPCQHSTSPRTLCALLRSGASGRSYVPL